MLDAKTWFFSNLVSALGGHLWVILNPGTALDISNGESVLRFAYYGASQQLAVLVITLFLIVFVIGIFRNAFLWNVVTGVEAISNTVGRLFAWAGLIMVLQQIMVIFLQSMFRVADISIGPMGVAFTQPIGWYADGLKLYNAFIITLCCAYTFVQRGHVRVDLVYSAVSFRTKRVLDMIMTLMFMVPTLMLIWFYGWFYMWRHLIRPNISATDSLDRVVARARAFRWDVETFSASPSGFNAYFIFKLLIIIFAAMMMLQAFAFFYRSYLEWVEGPEAEGKELDLDRLEPTAAAPAAPQEAAR